MLLTQFGPRFVVGLDLDPKQIIRARRRLTSKFPGRVTFVVSSAKELPFPNEYFDAAVDFGVLHHVVQWQQAMAEIRRILKPNGRFFFEEVTRDALNRRLYRTFLKHPTENRFSREEFVAELAHHGVNLLGRREASCGKTSSSESDNGPQARINSQQIRLPPSKSSSKTSATTRSAETSA